MKIEEFIQEQLNERYKHFLIYGPALYGKTKFAKLLSNKISGTYVNVLQEFRSDAKKKSIIDIFGPAKFISFIQSFNSNSKIFIFDQFDFLINTWSDNEFRELLKFIDRNESDKCYIFIMQNHRLLERENNIMSNDKEHSRQINIFDIKQGGLLYG